MATATVQAPSSARRVLVIDDEPAVLRVLGLLLERNGFRVDTVASARDALRLLEREKFDVVLSDIIMPELSGVDFLRELRRHDLDVPVILMTAGPTLDSALDAIEYGAQQYLLKPVEPEALVKSVGRAAALGELARLKRQALTMTTREALPYNDRATLEAVLKRAFDTIHAAFQPIVSMKERRLMGYEALMRCDETLFASYGALLAAADRIGWRTTLSKTIYQRIGRACAELPEGALLFVNVHPLDAQEGMIVGGEGTLEPIARSVVLEVSEHAPPDQLDVMASSLKKLRGAGFRIALDDLGTGPSGLVAFTRLSPDFAKLDRTLLAGLDADPQRQKVVRAMYALCAELGLPLIAEGVETAAEREALRSLGADLAQGNVFGAPAAGFEGPTL
ncbi:MAG TPA: EAL domain-containing protein [Gemmatimonadaceae bacterium]|nr:EAL domain-containing protein [Gemmatimonadaceae bacterium]